MTRLLTILAGSILVVCLAAQAPATDPFEEGIAAYKRLDYRNAMRLIRPLADKGNPRAQVAVGSMYAHGQGVIQDVAEGLRWLDKATSQGDAYAQFQRGFIYRQGLIVPTDYAEAMKWYRLAAAQNYVPALYGIGSMHEDGAGVPRNDVESIKWFRAAANHDYPDTDFNYRANAQLKIGRKYAEGRSVPEDNVQAYMWLSLAAEQKAVGAAIFRDDVARRLSPAQLAEAQKLAREWKPDPQPIQ